MNTYPVVGLIVPKTTNTIPPDASSMYPDIRFVARGVGVQELSEAGYQKAWEAIVPAAHELAKCDVQAIMVMGTSLTFYRGHEAHQDLLERLRSETGLPVATMTSAIVDGLRHVGARRICVCTAYSEDINDRLRDFLEQEDFDILSIQGLGLVEFDAPSRTGAQEVLALADKVRSAAPNAEAMLVACGGLRMLNLGLEIEEKYGLPVISSTPAALRAAARLVGETGNVEGAGKLFMPLS